MLPNDLLADSIGTYFQERPQQVSFFDQSTSPTDSVESRYRWATKQFQALKQQNKIKAPSYFGTIKATREMAIPSLKNEIYRIKKKLIKLHRQEQVGIFASLEITKQNLFHFHLLVKTDLPLEEISTKLGAMVESDLFDLAYLEEIGNVDDVSAYTVKFTKFKNKQPLLLSKGLGVNHTFSVHYFDRTKGELIKTEREAYRKQLELPAKPS